MQANGELIGSRLGVKPVLRRIADLDIETDRGVTVDPSVLTTDANATIDDPDVDVVIELVGGTGVAKDFVLRALAQGKPVVTANKALLAEHGDHAFVIWLPPYSPELNLIEGLWGYLKRSALNNYFFGEIASLEAAIHEAFSELQQHPETALSLAYNTNLRKTA